MRCFGRQGTLYCFHPYAILFLGYSIKNSTCRLCQNLLQILKVLAKLTQVPWIFEVKARGIGRMVAFSVADDQVCLSYERGNLLT